MDRDQAWPERDLIVKAAEGDAEALQELLFSHYDRLAARLRRRMPASLQGVVSEEDVVQDSMIAAFRAIGTFEPRGRWAFYRWLCRIADNCLRNTIDFHHAGKRGGGRVAVASPAGGDSYDDLIDMLAGPRHTPSRSVAGHEAASAVQCGLASLKDDYRQAIQLRYVQRLPVADVARVMDRTPRAVHNLCRRGLQELRDALGQSSLWMTRK